ncbi:DUF1574 domain-containing protein [Brunnivagina elsteri]|uniref:DUF1574 domain-containing protein n=1 Tax=Brunnivagina elsteri CCALA 953 TaxID=987040 RepID=A0A2A2TGZ0_9CYAN|nr:DUF1574 domain-containing protein [Calothrix elsteri]PAX52936.1 DUF1574 domain-containing protein [Calothrix elsteri CCALA 953]
MKSLLPDRQKTILQWVSQATGINTLGVKVRLRGNDLHILCESVECPQRWHTLLDLLTALQQTDLDALKSGENNDQPSIYQVFVYGRKKGTKRPEWCHRVYLNQLDRHLEQVNEKINQTLLRDKSNQSGGALIISNESLARQGDPDAIARYLGETLSNFGVSVQVKVKKPDNQTNKRLWVHCKSSYSPDPTLIAEPIAQKLRHLKLSGYQDAVIVAQVQGESKTDWTLRIDLTPPEIMLKEWARWGDTEALGEYLNEKLAQKSPNTKITVTTSLQESTLHIFCSSVNPKDAISPAPHRILCMETIGTILEDVAPQAITAATLYGQTSKDADPAWIDWLSLPAKQHPDLAIPPLELATSADEPAILFLLERLLNPNLSWRLKTGGIRVLLLRKADLLHVMCDAPVCPNRKQVASKVIKLLRQIEVSGITGVRIYGRRAGNKEPLWHYGVDFQPRKRVVPEPTPEFAATSAYVRELLPSDSNDSGLRPDLTAQEVQTFVKGIASDWGVTARKFLLKSQLFMDTSQPSERDSVAQKGRLVALIWGSLGLLLTIQTDWVLNYFVSRTNPQNNPMPAIASQIDEPSNTRLTANTSAEKGNNTFNASEFTQPKGDNSQSKSQATATAILLAARNQTPTFNARQLDEQFALYRQRLQKNGTTPDILIIGSSRALRGIDPVALSKALATQGYRNLDIFNFGINGATSQVVDFILRQVLQPEEVPKIVIWADGSRAFNSGREDVTYRAITASPGYKEALEKFIAKGNDPNEKKSTSKSIANSKTNNHQENSYQAVDKWLNQGLAGASGTYQHRDRLKTILNDRIKSLPIFSSSETPPGSSKTSPNDGELDASSQSVDFDGFLPLSIRFDPTTYYQKHSKVSGSYDNDYKSFLLGNDQDTALQNILQFTQSQKISLVFVNTPLTAEYLDPIRTQHEQEFQQYMLKIASDRTHFVFRDLSLLYPQNNDFFSDPSHLNRYGAYELSKKLAKDPMIPWSNKK